MIRRLRLKERVRVSYLGARMRSWNPHTVLLGRQGLDFPYHKHF